MDVIVRKTTADDASSVQRVARASWHAAYGEVMGKETIDSWFDVDNVVADVNRTERPFYVAEQNGTILGFIIAISADEKATFHLYRVYVHPEHWKRGIGTRLPERLESEVENRGGRRLRLSVIEPNDTAIVFYESRGFERIDSYEDEQFNVERYAYTKKLE